MALAAGLRSPLAVSSLPFSVASSVLAIQHLLTSSFYKWGNWTFKVCDLAWPQGGRWGGPFGAQAWVPVRLQQQRPLRPFPGGAGSFGGRGWGWGREGADTGLSGQPGVHLGTTCSWISESLTWAGTGMLLWARRHSDSASIRERGVGDEGDPAQEAATTSCASLYLPPWREHPP